VKISLPLLPIIITKRIHNGKES